MIPVRETDKGFAELSGNPILTSLDGEERAPLRVILHESWSDEDRARFGVYLVEPFVLPEGKMHDGPPTYRRDGDRIVQDVPVRDIPPAPVLTSKQKVERMLSEQGLTVEDFVGVIEGRRQ